MNKIYPTDLTDTQWQYIEKVLLFEECKRKHNLKEIWNGIDGNKKVKGIKGHVVVDKNGFLIVVMVTVANMHDSKAASLLMRVLKELCSSVKTIIADGGYKGELAENIRNTFGYVLQVVISGYKKQGFMPFKKRWIIERTFAWLDYNRRLCRNYETNFDAAHEMVKIASIKLLLNKMA